MRGRQVAADGAAVDRGGLGLKIIRRLADAPEQKIAVGAKAGGAVGEADQAGARGREDFDELGSRGLLVGIRQSPEGGIKLEEREVHELSHHWRASGGGLGTGGWGNGGSGWDGGAHGSDYFVVGVGVKRH